MSRASALSTSLIGIVVGISAETDVAKRLSSNVLCAGGRPDVAARHAKTLIDGGATTLMSIGIAGGLAPGLPPGTIVVPDSIVTDEGIYPALAECAERARARVGSLYGGRRIVDTVAEKGALAARTGAIAVDLESGPVAREAAAAGIPFIAIRAIADPGWEALPPAALLPLDYRGRPILRSVLWSVLTNPAQISPLISTGRNTKIALDSLNRACRRLMRA